MTAAPAELITLDEAAKLIPGVDAATLKRRVRQGKLAAYRPGKFYMTTLADVQEFIQACRVQPKALDSGHSRPIGTSIPSGASEMESAKSVQERVLAKLAAPPPPKPKPSSPSTSTKKSLHAREIEILVKS